MKEKPKAQYGAKGRVKSNKAAVHFYNETGERQPQTIANKTNFTVFQVKNIKGKPFLRIGGPNEWLPELETNFAASQKDSFVPTFKKNASSLKAPVVHTTEGERHSLPENLDFDFVFQNRLLRMFQKNSNKVLLLYRQGCYEQMVKTICQGLEMITDRLLSLNKINPGQGWETASLSDQLGYLSYLLILPRKIMAFCLSLKNMANIDHYSEKARRFDQSSAITALKLYHDLLTYLVNTYEGKQLPYTDGQIQDDQNHHPEYYQRPQLTANSPTFGEYIFNKNKPKAAKTKMQSTLPQVNYQEPTVIRKPFESSNDTEKKKEKMSGGMKFLLTCFAILGLVIVGGIGYEVYSMMNNTGQTVKQVNSSDKNSPKARAANLSTKQLLALSIIYADRNDDSRFNNDWQGVGDYLANQSYNINRFGRYTFADETVTANNNNYVYVIRKDIGLAYQNKGKNRLVSFFDNKSNNPVQVYDYEMLSDVNDMPKVKDLAKKLTFTDSSEN